VICHPHAGLGLLKVGGEVVEMLEAALPPMSLHAVHSNPADPAANTPVPSPDASHGVLLAWQALLSALPLWMLMLLNHSASGAPLLPGFWGLGCTVLLAACGAFGVAWIVRPEMVPTAHCDRTLRIITGLCAAPWAVLPLVVVVSQGTSALWPALAGSVAAGLSAVAVFSMARQSQDNMTQWRHAAMHTARLSAQLRTVNLQLGESQRALERVRAAPADTVPSSLAPLSEPMPLDQRSRDLEARSVELARQAVTDSLTGLPNRKGINEHLNELLERDQDSLDEPAMALLFLDLDHFKEVNDLMGHLAGDSVLKVVADRLRESMPRGAFAARWGGDEFVVVLPGTRRPEHATRVAEQLRASLSLPVQLQERVARIGCCVGIAMAPAHGSTPEALIIAADHAVYSAKAEGAGRVRVFDTSLAEMAGRQHEIAQALPEAVELGQLAVAYQPIVSATTGEATHVEALTRWKHPQWGAVSPAEFIPVAEASGLIHAIGRWVLRQACVDAVRWPGANPPKVSVNVSAMQITSGRLLMQVHEALAVSNLPASRLVLELTESLPMAGRDGVDATLKELRAMGVTLAVDDFGTGYSSMVSLKNQPLSLIKVDRSFVQDVPGEGELLIRATVEVARCFGLKVVAEGVETRQQHQRLVSLGVDYLQGYLFGRPMPNTEFVAWLALRDNSELQVALRV
jgi:diguanylate cyclase (GGDEF)-like protein